MEENRAQSHGKERVEREMCERGTQRVCKGRDNEMCGRVGSYQVCPLKNFAKNKTENKRIKTERETEVKSS